MLVPGIITYMKKLKIPRLRMPRRKAVTSLTLRFFKWLGIGFVSFILHWIFPVPDRIEYSTIITDNKGEVVNAYLTKDQKWRMKTELEEISPLLQKTIIAKEDKHFYSHPGVNPFAVLRAFFRNLFG